VSEREKDDGFLIGIFVVLLFLLIGGLGMGGFMFVRMARAREMEARAAAERAIMAEEQARAAAQEAMRASTEAESRAQSEP
jgi:hypothetical protein